MPGVQTGPSLRLCHRPEGAPTQPLLTLQLLRDLPSLREGQGGESTERLPTGLPDGPSTVRGDPDPTLQMRNRGAKSGNLPKITNQ